MAEEQPRAEEYEEQHVHSVYEEIASHFSSTRYKPWPIIESFLQALPPGSTGLDIGCGNGKYLAVNKDIYIIGSDRSTSLAHFAIKHHPHSAIVADILSLPHPPHTFDFAICIAVIHHLSTRPRRQDAIRQILSTLTKNGEGLLYCWALEQEGSRRGWKEGGEQDVMVPWVKRVKGEEERVVERFYHLFRKGELEEDVVRAGGRVVRGGYEKDNWWVVCGRGDDG